MKSRKTENPEESIKLPKFRDFENPQVQKASENPACLFENAEASGKTRKPSAVAGERGRWGIPRENHREKGAIWGPQRKDLRDV